MRIISGTARGTKLYTLEGIHTRPTLDRVKEALFSKINEDLKGSTVLDLFSGSGALGLEALSRGAKKAYLVDNSFNAIKIINQNVIKTHLEEKSIVVQKDYQKAINYFYDNNIKFDIIFLDPPYKSNYVKIAVEYILENDLLLDGGKIIIETDIEDDILSQINDESLDIYDTRKYGRVTLIFMKRKG